MQRLTAENGNMAEIRLNNQYSEVLVAYTKRFGDVPPSIVSEEGARQLMLDALRRGTRIVALNIESPPQDLEAA